MVKVFLVNQNPLAIHPLIRSFHCFPHLLDQAELIDALGLRAGVTHGPLNNGIRCNRA